MRTQPDGGTARKNTVVALRLTRSVWLMVIGLLMAALTGVFATFGIRQAATILGVGGIIIFSIGMIVWHTEP